MASNQNCNQKSLFCVHVEAASCPRSGRLNTPTRTHASFAATAAASHSRGSSGRRKGPRSARNARRTNQNIAPRRGLVLSAHF
jgi:hypothetical protein